MNCPKCHAENRTGVRFCRQCGAKIEMQCPNCKANIPVGNKFCGKCGQSLQPASTPVPQELSFDEKITKIQRYLPEGLTEKILSQRDRIEGEKRQVTVMVCDMEGYTPLSEKIGPEEVYSLMDQVYEILIHEVNEYGGTVNELTGDGIMALFGAPVALEDAPYRAIQSALSIHRDISCFSEKITREKGIPPIRMRIGIHTGPVVVGTVGNDLRVEFKAVGDTVNLASRMEGLAEPDTTYVTEDVFRLTTGLVRFETLGKREVKGKKDAVPIYKVIAAKQDVFRPRLGAERRIYSEIVGRDLEMQRLELQVMKAINGEGSIVNIIGEAGIGKSRLVAELKGREVMKRVTLLEGRAISIGRNLSFHPIIYLLRHWVQIRDDDTEAAALSKLEDAIGGVYPEGINEVLPFVATLMGMKLKGRYAERVRNIEGEALEKLMLKSVRDLLIKSTELSPVVIVAEDLHWADTSSIELLKSLFRIAPTHKLLFINVFRPGYKETGENIIEAVKEKYPQQYVEIVLQPLDERNSETLINNMLSISGLKHAVIDQIVERAGGNPFFIEEVVRSLLDKGAFVIQNGVFEMTTKIDTMVIPRTINDVLMARIDRLEEKTRELVKIASVIGRSFFFKILTQVAGSIEDLDSRLSYLKEIQLIRERRRMMELEYLFKHALSQEAAYESILSQKRKELHLKVADSIEKVFKERLHEFYGMLAYHYSKGEDLKKAEEYMTKAGEEALRSSASAEALNYYQQGLKLYLEKYGKAADPEKLANFEKNIALAFFHKGQYENALTYFDNVLKRWGAGTPENPILLKCRPLYDLLGLIAFLYLPFRNSKRIPTRRENAIFDISYKRAITLVHLDPQRCFSEFIMTLKHITKFDIIQVENGFGMWVSASGLFSWTGTSFRLSRKLLAHASQLIGNDDIKNLFFYDLFDLLYNCFTGNCSSIKEYNEELVAFNLKKGEYWHISTYLVFYGYLAMEHGDFGEVERIIRKLSEIWECYGNENATEYRDSLKIRLSILMHRFDEGLRESDDAIAFQRQTGRELIIIYYLGYQAIIRIQLKDTAGAKESLFQANELLSKIGFVPPIYASGYLKAQFLFDLHLLERSIWTNDSRRISEYTWAAKRSGHQALTNASKYALDRAEIVRMIGTYYWLIGRQAKAGRFWSRSIKAARKCGADVQLAKTYMEVGRRLSEKTSRLGKLDGLHADECLERAKSLFERYGMEAELGEIHSLKSLACA